MPTQSASGRATPVVEVLHPACRQDVLDHLQRLDRADRSRRFGIALADEGIERYVLRLDFNRDILFGVYADDGRLIGLGHLALGTDAAEFGFSTDAEHRGRGIGQALFDRAVLISRRARVARLYMHCLATNEPVLRMARSARMRVRYDVGEALAYLDLADTPPDPDDEPVRAFDRLRAAR